jgi:hypothetical protein
VSTVAEIDAALRDALEASVQELEDMRQLIYDSCTAPCDNHAEKLVSMDEDDRKEYDRLTDLICKAEAARSLRVDL